MTSGTNRHIVLGLLLAVYVSNYLDRTILQSVLEPIKQEWSLSDSALGFLSGLTFAAFYATLGIPIAMLADRWNRRDIVAISAAAWSGMTMLCGFAKNFWQLLFARIGVGIGEAGGSPPSLSILADLYPLHRRATAMAVYSLGLPMGILLGFLIGGQVAATYGWRAAFLVVGFPGLFLGLAVRFCMKEPLRGLNDFEGAALSALSGAPGFLEALTAMLRRRSLVHLLAATTLAAFTGYGTLNWLSSFLARTHHMGLSERSLYLALMIGFGGVTGNLLTGYVADRLGRGDMRWKIWVVVIGSLISIPFFVAALLSDDKSTALICFVLPTLAGTIYLGPLWALTASLVGVRMRALANAISLFIVNLIGLGLGPLMVGFLSDWLNPRFGVQSLRYALLLGPTLNLWAALHFYLSSRTLRNDIEVTRAADLGALT